MLKIFKALLEIHMIKIIKVMVINQIFSTCIVSV